MTEFNAIVAREVDRRSQGTLETLTLADLPDRDVLVKIDYSSLNYKDALAVSGRGKICRSMPMVCGIDLAGTIAESAHPGLEGGRPRGCQWLWHVRDCLGRL